MKRIALLLLLLAVALLPITAVAEGYRFIQEIQEGPPSCWTQTYEAYGRTVQVDVPITLPNVEKVPIVEVRFAGEFIPKNADVYNDLSMSGDILTIAQSSETSFEGDGSTIPMMELGSQAENSPLSPEQAKAFVEKLIAHYETTTGPVEFIMHGQLTLSREYRKIKYGNDQIGIDFDTPVTEMGSYEMLFNQCFYGIPYYVSGYYAVNAKEQYEGRRPRGMAKATVASRDDYLFDYEPAIETGLYADDVPLVSFAKVKAAFEQWIEAGLIRNAYELRFGYMIYDNSQNLGDSFYLLPVWQSRCDVVQTPTQPDFEWSQKEQIYNAMLELMSVVVDAQSGEILDLYGNRHIDRQVATKIITGTT